MPKTVKQIRAFDGGMITSVNAKDLKENECSSLVNFTSRNIGSLKVLGAFVPSSDIATIAEGSFSPDISLNSGATFYTFTTDFKLDNTESPEIYIVYVDKADSQIYIHDKSNDTWQKFDTIGTGIDAKLGGAMTANQALEATYYIADGGLRICNPNFDMVNTIASTGASSVVLSHIKRNYINSNVTVDDWICHPSKCIPPIKNDTFANSLHFVNGSTGGAVNQGQFGVTIDIDRDKGDGSIEMQGRSIYATFTYDNAQESVPKLLGTISLSNIQALAPAPTPTQLGYIASLAAVINFGDNNVHLNENVHSHDDGTKKNWEQDGMITAVDDNGQVQSLVYTGIEDGTGSNNNAGGATLTGITGWIDTGTCSISYALSDEIFITNDGTGYVTGDTWTTTGGSPSAAATGTVTADGSGNITAMNITSHGNGYSSVPSIVITSSAGANASFSITITSELTTSSECTEHSGVWTDADIPGSADIEYDPPGEIERDDENLAIRPALTFRPKTDGANGQLLDYTKGGNRITHVNLYSNKFEDDNGTIPETGDYAYLTSFDLVNGHQKVDGQYTAWAADNTQSQSDQYTTYGEWIGSLGGENYQMRTGLFPDTWDTHIRWRTATVLNRRVYAGNITQKPTGESLYRHYPDRIVKSMPNSFDTFNDYDTLDVVVDDGDEIVALDNFGGLLLQFKKNTLYIIDVATEPEFLKATYKYRGIPSVNAYFRTDFGVIFANSYGAYFFNGESIKELVVKTIEKEWSALYKDDISVGFDPKTKQAYFISSFADYFYIFDMTTSSWMKGDKADRFGSGDASNFFLYESNLHIGKEGTDTGDESDGPIEFKVWGESLSSNVNSDYSYKSKEFDFDNASTNKIISKMYITYKSNHNDAANIKPKWKIYTGSSESPVTMNESFANTSGEWRQIECTPVGGSVTCKSMVVVLETSSSSSVDSEFEVNDISIVFREKRVK